MEEGGAKELSNRESLTWMGEEVFILVQSLV
jgi:hypothetical protein